MKKRKKGLAILCIAAMAGSLFMQSAAGMAATKKVKLNKTKISLKEGETYKIKLKNGNKKAKVTWETSKKKVVKITQKSAKGKTAYAKVKGLKAGKAKIRAVYRVGKKVKKLNCTVTVKKKGNKAVLTKKPAPVTPPSNDTPVAPTENNDPVITPDNRTPEPTPGNQPENPQTEPITLYNEKMVAPVIMDSSYEESEENQYAERSYRQITRAVTDLRQDIAMVTGAIDDSEIQAMFDDNTEDEKERLEMADASKVPDFVTDTTNLNADCAIIVGTIDDSPMIKKLMDSGKLEEAKSLKGVWEGYVIKQVKNPVDGVGNALVIAGSDARGTIYGIYTVSEAIGVSPFYWYSDVPVQVKDEIQFDAVVPIVNDGPDVKYRGIFVNDEEKSNDWAEKKFTGDGKNGPGVNYYRKVFELMLRMKANTLWPAMHNCSIAFNKVVDEDGNPVNAKEAAEYGIIMSASHCEILLRNNVGEWGDWFNKNKGRFPDVKYANNSGKAYDFTLNRELLLEYWRERLTANKDFESILTVGIRGPHDEAFNCEDLSMYEGNSVPEQKVEFMKDVISCQRQLIAEVYGEENVQKVPQAFIPYKEINDVYNAGLNEYMLWDGEEDYNGDGVIDWKDDNTDIMLMWAEDNENYLRQDLTDEEAARKGGAGIYYHISYWGPPSSYLWLNSTSLYVMSEQMHRGYDIGADDYWILNVGDIKPSEPSMEFFLKMAWDSEHWNDTTVKEYLQRQAMRDYGMNEADAKTMADAISEYYQINGTRKAEFYAKADFGTAPEAFSATANGDEAMLWIEGSKKVVEVLDTLYNNLSEEYKDAFYEQFYYNMLSVNDIIENFGYYEKNLIAAAQGRIGSANVYAQLSKDAAKRVRERKNEFNSRHNDKWTGFMDYDHPGRGYQLVGDGGEKYGEVLKVSGSWTATLNMCETLTCNIPVKQGWNDIFLYRSDASFVFDKMVIETVKGAVAQSVLGPNESPNNIAEAPEIKIGKLPPELESYSPAPAIIMDNFINLGMNPGESKAVACSAYATNGERVTVTASSSNKDRIQVSVEENQLIIKSGSQAGSAVISVIATANGCTQVKKEFTITVRDISTGGLYAEKGGEVVINAADALLESAYSWTEVTAPNVWEMTSDKKGVKVSPDVNKTWTNTSDLSEAPKINFRIKISTKGTYYLFTNMSNPNNDADSYHVIVDGGYRYTHNDGDLSGTMLWRSAGKGVELSAGEHTITIAAREDGLVVNQLCLTTNKNKELTDGVLEVPSAQETGTGSTPAPSVPPTVKPTAAPSVKPTVKPTSAPTVKPTAAPTEKPGAYIESGGRIVINAVDALENTEYASYEGASDGVHSWEASGKGIQVTPDTGKNWTTATWEDLNGVAPVLKYKIQISNPGDYYLFVNMTNPNDAADSYFVAVDGVYRYLGATGQQILPETWYSEKKVIHLTEGEHELIIFAREDGLLINQFLLSNDKDIILEGLQPVSNRN